MEPTGRSFNFTSAMAQLCSDISQRSPEFNHIRVERIAFNLCQTRRAVSHGLYASLMPLRFEGGATHTTSRGITWAAPRLVDPAGHECFYMLSFYLPRFQNVSLEEKLSIVFHELWHIHPEFNGDVRRHTGRCYAHGSSRKKYDSQMNQLAQDWLARNPPSHVYEFLAHDFAELISEHGKVFGSRWKVPKLVRM